MEWDLDSPHWSKDWGIWYDRHLAMQGYARAYKDQETVHIQHVLLWLHVF